MGVRDTIAKALMGIKAYHSSPHDFDKFDLKKIGTGEGAQVYGHGLYFAENPAVSGQGGQYWKSFLGRFGPQEQVAAKYLSAAGQDHDRARQMLLEGIKRDSAEAGYLNSAYHNDDLAAVKLLESKGLAGPRTYEVNIKADPAQMLDWDKPLGQQGEAAKAFVGPPSSMFPENMTGAELYRMLGRGNEPAVSKSMSEAGIPGIKYLDEGSRAIQPAITDIERAIQQGGMYKGVSPDMWASRLDELKATPLTNNYVVFDPANIDIRKKYGVAAAPTAALGATYDQSQYEVQP